MQNAVPLIKIDRIRGARHHVIQSAHESGISELLITLRSELCGLRVAEVLVVAEQVFGGFVVIGLGPTAVVFLKVVFAGVGEIGGRERRVVVELD